MLAEPKTAARVAEMRAVGEEMDRVYAMNLAMIRKAGELTQGEVAARLGIGQGDVSKLERRDDWLLSTLLKYLTAAGADDARIVVTVHGQELDLDLSALREAAPAHSSSTSGGLGPGATTDPRGAASR
jgi:DNA-binding transcriptional regulator YiaG